MCGLFCLFLRRPLTEADIALGRAGTAALAHRGPDGQGEWLDRAAGVYIGHRRLAIIDPTPSSAQPMVRDGVVLAFNGEIYNYPELRSLLQQDGRRFETEGDVEVLLRGWQHWGPSLLDRVEGMFASVVWDGDNAQIATDPFGEKPLFMAETNDGIYLSSEIGSLARLLDLRPSLSETDLVGYLALGFIAPPATAFQDVRRIGSATHLEIRGGRIAHRRTYWQPPLAAVGKGRPRPLSEAELDHVHGALIESVKGRLLADVPVGIFLSRGIDSALVAAITRRDHGMYPRCLTVSFPEGGVPDESTDAARIAAHLGLDHQVIVNNSAPDKITPQALLDILQQPSEGITMFSVYQMSRAAAPQFKVALTGVGGDELFSGYGRNAYYYRHRHAYGVPEALRRLAATAAHPLARSNRRMERVTFEFGVRNCELLIAQRIFPAISWLRQLRAFPAWCEENFGGSRPLPYGAYAFEWNPVMSGLRLPNFDLSSMRAGLELRTPFVSRRVTETLARFDPRAFLAFGQKSIGRRLVKRYLPDQLISFPKTGFYYPLKRFLAAAGPRLPRVHGVPANAVEDLWQRRLDGRGWTRLAVRLVMAAEFLRLHDREHSALAAQ